MEGISFCFPWEIDLMVMIQSYCGPIIQTIAHLLSMLGEETVIIAILGYIYWCRDKELGKSIGFTVIPAMLAASMMKNVVLRRRPYFDHKEIKCLRAPSGKGDIYDIALQGYSFPSMHSANSVSVLFPIAHWTKKKALKVICFGLPFLIGLSRIILGAHYPTDVLTGWMIGIILFVLTGVINKKLNNKMWLLPIYGLLALPGWFFCHSTEFYTVYGLFLGMMPAYYLEENYVKFENTTKVMPSIIRLLGGMASFMLITSLLKMPFSKEMLEADALLPHLLRAVRYMIGIFVVMGIYPMAFRYRFFK